MSEHTKEPWKISEQRITDIVSSDGVIIAKAIEPAAICSTAQYDERDANAQRIVACVNACAGMNAPQAEITRLKDANKELVEALEFYAQGNHYVTWDSGNSYSGGIEFIAQELGVLAQQTLAKAKGIE